MVGNYMYEYTRAHHIHIPPPPPKEQRTEADAQVHGLGDPGHVHAEHQIVADLGDPARAGPAAVHDPLAHVPQRGLLGARDAAWGAANHEGERAGLGA